jgi:hypothetical protein
MWTALPKDTCTKTTDCRHSLSDEFYALFYLALYNEALNRPDVATLYLRQALGTKYGQQSNDYMVACARIQSKDF